MSERDRGLAIAMLAEAYQVKTLTPATIRIYEKALQGVPVAVLEPMVQRTIKTRQWFPKVSELLEDAEACRVELLRALTYGPCAECSESPGWIAAVDARGVARVKRCRCWEIHQQKVQALGVGTERLALPVGEE